VSGRRTNSGPAADPEIIHDLQAKPARLNRDESGLQLCDGVERRAGDPRAAFRRGCAGPADGKEGEHCHLFCRQDLNYPTIAIGGIHRGRHSQRKAVLFFLFYVGNETIAPISIRSIHHKHNPDGRRV
jgi:hypothetical protein